MPRELTQALKWAGFIAIRIGVGAPWLLAISLSPALLPHTALLVLRVSATTRDLVLHVALVFAWTLSFAYAFGHLTLSVAHIASRLVNLARSGGRQL